MTLVISWVKRHALQGWRSIAWLLWWCLFTSIWGIWHWGNSAPFNAKWWFDEAGHMLFGFTLGLYLLYRYLSSSSRFITGVRKQELHTLRWKIGSKAFLSGLIWEYLELTWDNGLQPWLFQQFTKAQHGQFDTLFDITLHPPFALIAIAFRMWFDRWRMKNHNVALLAEIELINGDITGLQEERRKLVRQLNAANRAIALQRWRARMRQMRKRRRKPANVRSPGLGDNE